MRLRTQLLIATLLIICALSGIILLIVRNTVRNEVKREVQESVAASVSAFKNVQDLRQMQLSRAAAMLAELPTLKALMTTRHAPTIQDGSTPFWGLAGSDLFVLADTDGEVMALHAKDAGLDSADVKGNLTRSHESDEEAAWWYSDGRLYWVFLRPISSGAGSDEKVLGEVAIGYEVDSSVAQQLALVAGSKIALATGNRIIASTLPANEERELQERIRRDAHVPGPESAELALGRVPYQVASVSLHQGMTPPVQCYVLLPLRPRLHFIMRLDATIVALGISAVLLATLLLSFVASTITRPLENLVAGVRALAVGDFNYYIQRRGSSELVELGEAFSKMRGELMASQMRLIEAERLAALAHAASSISHDLRHYLAAVVANAEFLYEAERLKLDPDEIYEEIKVAAEQMTDLIDSLRELAHERSTIYAVPGSIDQSIRRALDTVFTRPELRNRGISIQAEGDLTGVFDPKKIERAFLNLILNAFQATADRSGKIDIHIFSTTERFEVRIADNGPGIPEAIRDTLFDPFVSFGKVNGTGLGLAIVSKIIQDHGGTVGVEGTSESGTVFLVQMPRFQDASGDAASSVTPTNGPGVISAQE